MSQADVRGLYLQFPALPWPSQFLLKVFYNILTYIYILHATARFSLLAYISVWEKQIAEYKLLTRTYVF